MNAIEQAKTTFENMTDKQLVVVGMATYNSMKDMPEGELKETTRKFLKLIEAEQDKRGIY